MPEFVKEEEYMKRFQNMKHVIGRKAYQLVNMVMARVPVTEAVIMLSVLIAQVLIFRSFIAKYIRDLFLR